MEIFTTKIKTNLDGVLQMTQMIDGIMMTGDNAANQILVELYKGVNRVIIPQNIKIVGYFVRSDGYTLEEDGEVTNENEIKVIIPEAAYQVSGVLSIAIRMFDEEEEKVVTTRRYAVVKTTRRYHQTVETRKYYNITVQRRYYDSINDEWINLEDGEDAPDGAEVEEYQTGEWIKLEDGEDAPNGAEVETTVNNVTVILEDGIEPPSGVDVEVIETTEWITLGDDEEAPAGVEVVTSTNNIITWGKKVVVATLNCYVQITETDSLIDIYHHIPDVQELLSYIESIDDRREAIEQAESARITAEAARISAETARATAESTRQSQESTRQSQESTRQSNESTRQSQESTRESNESTRQSQETTRQNAQAVRNALIDGMTVEAVALNPYETPTATISEVSGHKHIIFGLCPGDPFVIQKTFASISEMNSYSGTDVKNGQFVIIASNEEDPDNAKMYVKSSSGYSFVTDLSGAQGIQGPRGYTGNGISSMVLNQDYTLTVNYTDGTSYTTPNSIRGVTGETGNGISQIEMNSDYTLTITMTNGTTYTTDPIRGAEGQVGASGNGIASISLDPNTNGLNITMTNGTSYTTPSIKGDPGNAGSVFTYDSQTNDLIVRYY